jgi:hypothetical protein
MRFEKKVIYRMNMPYAVGSVRSAAGTSVVCATEDHGPVVMSDPPFTGARVLAQGPGGCMALVADPDAPSELWAVMGCFVGYRFQGGGIYRIRAGELERAADLPFAHRIGVVHRGGRRFLVAANLASDKKDAADWSKPGAVCAAELDGPSAALTLKPIFPGVHKNHGFLVTDFEGKRSVMIGCAEGLFALDLEEGGSDWPPRRVLPQEVSEMAVADLDGDGVDELVTIEPFHGSALRAYRRSGAGWQAFWETEISFGHCVLAGTFEGRPSVLVSSRTGSKDLVLFRFDGSAPGRPEAVIVDAGAAAANMLLLPWQGRDRIFSANQAAGELVLYTAAD